MKVIGLKEVEFIGKDGNTVRGTQVYFQELIKSGGRGFTCDKFFLSEKKKQELPEPIELGDEIELLFNRYGKVASITIKPTK